MEMLESILNGFLVSRIVSQCYKSVIIFHEFNMVETFLKSGASVIRFYNVFTCFIELINFFNVNI